MEPTAPLDGPLLYFLYFVGATVALLVFYYVIRAAVAAGNKKSVALLDRIAYTLIVQTKKQGVGSEELKTLIQQEKLAELEKEKKYISQETFNERRDAILAG